MMSEVAQCDVMTGRGAATRVQEDKGQRSGTLPGELTSWLEEHLPTETAEMARKIYHELLPLLTAGQTSDEPMDPFYVSVWWACVLYIAKSLQPSQLADDRESNGGVPLTKILRATGADLFDFLYELPVSVRKLEPKLPGIIGEGVSAEKYLKVEKLKTHYAFLVIFSRKFKDMYCKLFGIDPNKVDVTALASFKMAWTLLMLTKKKVLQDPNLVSCFRLLVCIGNFLLVNAPRAFWEKGDDTEFGRKLASCEGQFNSLHHVSESNQNRHRIKDDDIKEIESVMKEVDCAVVEILNSNEAIRSARKDNHHESRLAPTAAYYEGLLEEDGPLLQQSLELVDGKYEEFYNTLGEIDERDFILKGFVPELPSKPEGPTPVATPDISGSFAPSLPLFESPGCPLNPALRSMAGCLQSPLPSQAHQSGGPHITPVTESQNSVNWLKEFTHGQAAEPSEILKGYFTACNVDVSSKCQKRVSDTAHIVFPRTGGAPSDSSNAWAGILEEGILGIKLYYKVLEAILLSEEKRTQKKNFTSLLTCNSFHLALLACSFQIVANAYKMASLEFPIILQKLNLKAFDFSKVIEPFVKQTRTLPTKLKRGLFLIEERIIEQMAWQPGSSIYPLIAGACQQMPLCKSPTPKMPATPTYSPVPPPPRFSPPKKPLSGLTPGARSPTSAFKVFTSPLKKVCGDTSSPNSSHKGFQGPLPRRLKLPEASDAKKKHPARTVLDDFFRKVLKLTAFRLFDMKSFLMSAQMDSTKIVLQVYNVIQHGLYEQTHLFYGRHLDQILLSALYGVCKVNQLNVHFKDIIQHYRHQPQNRPVVFKTVVIQQSEPDLKPQKLGDIIEFYNKIFVPNLKSFLLSNVQASVQASPQTAGDGSGTPPRKGSTRARVTMLKNVHPPPPEIVAPFLSKDKPTSKFRNVYVSPSRSEQGAPCSTRTMHAFVGKTTNPYLTPSQELSAINARLNPTNSPAVGSQALQPKRFTPVAVSTGVSNAEMMSKVKAEPESGNFGVGGRPVVSDPRLAVFGMRNAEVGTATKTDPPAGQSTMAEERPSSVTSSTGSGSPVIEEGGRTRGVRRNQPDDQPMPDSCVPPFKRQKISENHWSEMDEEEDENGDDMDGDSEVTHEEEPRMS
ncbi:hypothetical protein BSKO_06207 [Bryopsis sp. KO-2023]|nr:hypothetical protein BSKO_06207 [Bryopsis sp. KO-2023]